MDLKGTKTEQNLYKTFAGESRARNKYTFFCEKARRQGYQYIASVFAETAQNELAHSRRVFNDFLNLNKSTEENLLDAAMGEAFETEKLYKEFEETARTEGYPDIADFYKELREVEEAHKDRFMDILKKLKEGKAFRRDIPVKWCCMNCGYEHDGKEAPSPCPLCKFPQGYFKVCCEDYK
ncbi:MAG: ferritin family protein [Clostridium sp.]|uniref:rubrerythrin family protein n=1 Tax=Clostridium sp. TaxID=1506 RepID=UPI002FCAFBF1